MRLPIYALACLLTVATPALAQQQISPEAVADVERILSHAKYKAAMTALGADHDRIVAENIALSEVPAPPFKEAAKAKAFYDLFSKLGLSDVTIDPEGNVTGIRKGKGNGPLLAVASHLDTVFPEGTDVKVKRDGDILRGPGIGDNSRGLAVILGLVRALEAARIETDSDILFVASVGEEGLGDLRGMKHLFLKGPWKDKIKTFIAMDGLGLSNVMTTALGSKRYKLTFTGPGGHSYRAFGLVNPMYAMGQFMVEFAKTQVPELTTYNIGVIGGGTSVNSIPSEGSMEVDIRSVSPPEVEKVSQRMETLARAAVDAENTARSTKAGKIELKVELVGDRPAGTTVNPFFGARLPGAAAAPETAARNSRLAAWAWQALIVQGVKPVLDTSSTDANIAMNLGIPAITIASGSGDRMHALDEWMDVGKDKSMKHIGMALTTVLAAAGLRD
jgi:hypothetical protein